VVSTAARRREAADERQQLLAVVATEWAHMRAERQEQVGGMVHTQRLGLPSHTRHTRRTCATWSTGGHRRLVLSQATIRC
jgi:hypothetical protein